MTGRADLIVTSNLRHFPAEACEQHGFVVRSPDAFLCELWELDPESMVDVLHAQARRRRQPPTSFREMLDRLAGALPEFVEIVSGVTSEDRR